MDLALLLSPANKPLAASWHSSCMSLWTGSGCPSRWWSEPEAFSAIAQSNLMYKSGSFRGRLSASTGRDSQPGKVSHSLKDNSHVPNCFARWSFGGRGKFAVKREVMARENLLFGADSSGARRSIGGGGGVLCRSLL